MTGRGQKGQRLSGGGIGVMKGEGGDGNGGGGSWSRWSIVAQSEMMQNDKTQS